MFAWAKNAPPTKLPKGESLLVIITEIMMRILILISKILIIMILIIIITIALMKMIKMMIII